jgi:UDP-2,3-diacylglucosamine pyrophosphatase LpxH
MENVYCDTLILSDLHLGAEASRAREAFDMLKGHRFRRLILLGDIFCDLNFGRLKKEHWRFLSHIRKLSNPKRGVEVVWVEGNHDHGLADVMSHLVGVRVYQEYLWTFRGIRHLAIHGHQFDRFVFNNLKLCQVGTSAFLQLQKLDSKHNRITRWIDRMNTRWMRMSPKVASGAFAHAFAHGADRVFCGHTHQPMCLERDGIEYYNTGSWLAGTATYVTICEKGVQIHDYDSGVDHRHSGEERGDAAAEVIEFSREAALLEDADYESVPG